MHPSPSGAALARIVLAATAALLTAAPLHAQSTESGRAGPRDVLPRDYEMALARSAAPAVVSDDATVLVWTGDDYVTAAEGQNGVTCYVARSWPESLEPHCFDEEGSRTILPIHLLQARLWHEGKSSEEIDAAIAEGLRSGAFRLPTRPVMSYMMSAGQHLISDEGQVAGSWQPHLMIYYPYLTPESMGLGPVPSTDAAVIVDPGQPLSNIMIVVKDFVPFEGKRPSS